MSAAAPIAVSNSVTYQPKPAAPVAADESGLSFGEILSDLNPLQYLPVVGTIYRAVTGDTIPRPLREAGSLLVSGLMGGPIGVATNLAMLGFEKLTGIDLEEVEQRVITALLPTERPVLGPALIQSAAVEGAGAPMSTTMLAAVSPAGGLAIKEGTAKEGTATASASGGSPWTRAQLAAYGVVREADGDLRQGDLVGADVLNALQLRAGTAMPLGPSDAA